MWKFIKGIYANPITRKVNLFYTVCIAIIFLSLFFWFFALV